MFKTLKEMTKFGKKDDEFTAERAWVETTYGSGSWRPLERRIADKQKQIKDTIKGKFAYSSADSVASLKSYRCVVDIEEDLKNNVDEILEPFREGGFDIINLSERISEINDENVYLISWRHIFDKPKTISYEKIEQMICENEV